MAGLEASVRRAFVVLAGVGFAVPALANDMKPEQARRFVIGKVFSYSCFEGTRGAGRIQPDGSVIGTIQMQGQGPTRYAVLPPGTVQVKGEKICASLKGMPFEPCFNLQQTNAQAFRGALSGFSFAYCDFTRQGNGRSGIMRTATREHGKPAALRSSLSE